MTDRFLEPDDLPEREDAADRDERLGQAERDAEAVAETRAEDAAIQRCVSGLEVGDGTPALVLHVQQSETLGLVIGDSLQQGTQQRGFIVSINVEHPTRGP